MTDPQAYTVCVGRKPERKTRCMLHASVEKLSARPCFDNQASMAAPGQKLTSRRGSEFVCFAPEAALAGWPIIASNRREPCPRSRQA